MHNRDESISTTDFSRLCQLIYEEAGIVLGSQKKTMLEGRLRRRLKALEIHSYRAYCDYLFSDRGQREELVHLVDVVTTNKTDFFREPAHFEFLTSQALPEWAAQESNRRPFLIWSAGCSTGEEPYTLAMVLSEYARAHSGFSFRILATDISTVVLEKAAGGIYSTETVRPVPHALRVRYFMRGREPGSTRVRVVPELRRTIEFRRLNFMDSSYDIQIKADAIFCRNVIIYFDRPTQQSILTKLTQHLRPESYLFMGHSETLHELDLPVDPVAPALYRRLHGRF
ncbi:CheR family methyltransferase [Occallatibacter riparius]|uniref:protein-glutamate O-methyltransferase n=1 Tax=Occallatibacter riparius TaxID=1002689 RepID=A0A9J7BNG6_9BACT|nr:protein-glutamate O-methyltransferase [Occallatibacter riparius]UWZ82454.1 protein-glutamate O-methyltransferase [Occallatibacter riparius]